MFMVSRGSLESDSRKTQNNTTNNKPDTPSTNKSIVSTRISKNTLGGIDFTNLPLTQSAQALPVLNLPSAYVLRKVNLNIELNELQGLLQKGVIPSAEKIKLCFGAVLQAEDPAEELNILRALIASILRLEEDYMSSTESALIDILTALESIKI